MNVVGTDIVSGWAAIVASTESWLASVREQVEALRARRRAERAYAPPVRRPSEPVPTSWTGYAALWALLPYGGIGGNLPNVISGGARAAEEDRARTSALAAYFQKELKIGWEDALKRARQARRRRNLFLRNGRIWR